MGLGLFIFALIFIVAGIGAIGYGLRNESGGGLAAGSVLVALAFFLWIISSSTVVGTRTLGIETSFGKTVGVMQPGYHWKRPWANVQDWPGSLQTFTQDVKVRLANQTTADVDASVQWKLDPNANVLDLFQNYKKFDNIQPNVIARQASRSMNDVFGTYDPLSVDQEGHAKVVVSDLATKVEQDMKAELPSGIQITNITIVKITFDPSVQAQINNIINATAATKVAQQQELTNQAIAKANQALQDSGTKLTPEILTQNCLNIVQQAAKAGEPLPPALSCNFFGGNSGTLVSAK